MIYKVKYFSDHAPPEELRRSSKSGKYRKLYPDPTTQHNPGDAAGTVTVHRKMFSSQGIIPISLVKGLFEGRLP